MGGRPKIGGKIFLMEMKTLQTQTWMEPLSHREVEILGLISEGLSNQEISRKLLLSGRDI